MSAENWQKIKCLTILAQAPGSPQLKESCSSSWCAVAVAVVGVVAVGTFAGTRCPYGAELTLTRADRREACGGSISYVGSAGAPAEVIHKNVLGASRNQVATVTLGASRAGSLTIFSALRAVRFGSIGMGMSSIGIGVTGIGIGATGIGIDIIGAGIASIGIGIQPISMVLFSGYLQAAVLKWFPQRFSKVLSRGFRSSQQRLSSAAVLKCSRQRFPQFPQFLSSGLKACQQRLAKILSSRSPQHRPSKVLSVGFQRSSPRRRPGLILSWQRGSQNRI